MTLYRKSLLCNSFSDAAQIDHVCRNLDVNTWKKIPYRVPRQENDREMYLFQLKEGKNFSNPRLFWSSLNLSWRCQESFSEGRNTSLLYPVRDALSILQHVLEFSNRKGVQQQCQGLFQILLSPWPFSAQLLVGSSAVLNLNSKQTHTASVL